MAFPQYCRDPESSACTRYNSVNQDDWSNEMLKEPEKQEKYKIITGNGEPRNSLHFHRNADFAKVSNVIVKL